MCGRFNLHTSPAELAEIFDLLRMPELEPRYNIAPTQPVLGIVAAEAGREGRLFHWGLIPSWAKDPKLGGRMINARAETVATKPAFRAAFKRRRCLIPADGFYERKQTGGRTKQPMHIGRRDGRPFAFAGLWERWGGADGSEIESCTIVTTDANALLAEIHDRMPVILPERAYAVWLDREVDDREVLEGLLGPCPADELRAYPVATLVNSPKNDVPACLEPVGEQGTLFDA
jgi:putative SOS response-associated peptidase YedK